MTLEDSNIYVKIYVPNIFKFKGNNTQSNPEQVVADYITPPKEIMDSNNNITISGYILFVN